MNWENYREKYYEKAIKSNYEREYIEENLIYAKKIHDKGFPIIYNIEHFSKLVGFDKALLTTMSFSSKSFYRKFRIPKKSGGYREIHEPLPMLKEVQKWILKNILYKASISPFAKAYIPNKNIKDNVRFHKKKKLIVKLDIEDFFNNITNKQVNNFFLYAGYEKKLAFFLTSLITMNNSLPQGAPTSPYMSNIVMKSFDTDISKICQKNKILYTRYADDLTFSGNVNKQKIINSCEKRLEKIGLKLNLEKTKVLKPHNKQSVTGIIVNEKVQIDRISRDEYRKLTYYIREYGVENHLKKIGENVSPKQYLISLKGKISYAIFINPYDKKLKSYLKIVEDALISYQI